MMPAPGPCTGGPPAGAPAKPQACTGLWSYYDDGRPAGRGIPGWRTGMSGEPGFLHAGAVTIPAFRSRHNGPWAPPARSQLPLQYRSHVAGGVLVTGWCYTIVLLLSLRYQFKSGAPLSMPP